jgi:SAM-dependent methyltransferase
VIDDDHDNDDDDDVAAVRTAYDATADLYTDVIGVDLGPATEAPLDLAVLRAFVESVPASGRVADLGCGPGRVAAFLRRAGLAGVVGFDLSSAMVAAARAAHPDIPFDVARLDELPLDDAALAGAVCWYSIIHTPPDGLAAIAAELARVLQPGGELLVAFQAGGGEAVHRSEIDGRAVSLTSHRHAPDTVDAALAAAGLTVYGRVVREAELAFESTPQAFLLARA